MRTIGIYADAIPIMKNRKGKTMIEIKATTNIDSGITNCEVDINANGIEYMAEVISIIESLMKGLKNNDRMLHTAVLKVISDHPHILLGEDEESDKAQNFEKFVAMAKIREGVN